MFYVHKHFGEMGNPHPTSLTLGHLPQRGRLWNRRKPLPGKETNFLIRQGFFTGLAYSLTSASVMARISFFCWGVSNRMTLWILPSL